MSDELSEEVKVSKLLSFILRHKPEAIGVVLDNGGWVDVDTFLACLQASGKTVTRQVLESVVETSTKQRFALSADRQQIRANQGHSVDIDLQLPTLPPPGRLFHGTATRFLDAIQKEGLRRQKRHHVHLTVSQDVAISVGARHGTPIVLTIDAKAMHDCGYEFFLSANGVWLTSHVPSKYLLPVKGA